MNKIYNFNRNQTEENLLGNTQLNHFYVVVGLFDKHQKETIPFRQYAIHIPAEDEGEANDLAFNYCLENIGILDNEYFDIVDPAIIF